MSDVLINIEDACAAARRYAQLVFYHDNFGQRQKGAHPFWAWRDYMAQFSRLPRGVAIVSLISHSYVMEFRRLVDEGKERRNGQGKLPAKETPGKWSLV